MNFWMLRQSVPFWGPCLMGNSVNFAPERSLNNAFALFIPAQTPLFLPHSLSLTISLSCPMPTNTQDTCKYSILRSLYLNRDQLKLLTLRCPSLPSLPPAQTRTVSFSPSFPVPYYIPTHVRSLPTPEIPISTPFCVLCT